MNIQELIDSQINFLTNSCNSFEIKLDNVPTEKHILVCKDVVRYVPGKRIVCKAHWNDKIVFAKLFFRTFRALRNIKAEKLGLQALLRNDIPAPEILFSGTAENGKFLVLLLEAVTPSISLKERWLSCITAREKVSFLNDIVTILSSHHKAGILQRDLHLDNFLLSNNTIYSLDGNQLLITKKPLSIKRSQNHLALLFAQFNPENDSLASSALSFYLGKRDFKEIPGQKEIFLQSIFSCRRVRLRKYLKKIYRDCTEFVTGQYGKNRTIILRSYNTPVFKKILDNPDSTLSFPATQYLKKGNSCTVWISQVEDKRIVIKRYNIKGILHGLKTTFRKSRASKSWRNAHILKKNGIKTAQPIAMVEERLGLFQKRSFYITEYLDGNPISVMFQKDNNTNKSKFSEMVKIVVMLKQLWRQKISHGDLKATNIIYTACGPGLIDLDSMRQHKTEFFFQRNHKKDINRFLKNWSDNIMLQNQFNDLIDLSSEK